MEKSKLNILFILSFAIFMLSCGSSSSSNTDNVDEYQDYRILKVVENIDDNSSKVTNYEYNEQNLLVKKTITLDNGVVQDTEKFLYNENNQIVSQIKIGNIVFYHSSVFYKYGNLIYDKNNLPIVVSSDGNSSFIGTTINTHVDYSYNLNEQQKVTSIDYTTTYRKTIGLGMDLPENEEIINYTYDENGRVISKNDISYTYNEFGKLASKTRTNYKTLYNYNEQNILITEISYTVINGEESKVNTKSYFYENGLYDSSSFSITYFDQGQYISSGIY